MSQPKLGIQLPTVQEFDKIERKYALDALLENTDPGRGRVQNQYRPRLCGTSQACIEG